MAEQSRVTFEEELDPFPDEDSFDRDDSCLDEKYKELSKELFGVTVEETSKMIGEFKEAAMKEGIGIPGKEQIRYIVSPMQHKSVVRLLEKVTKFLFFQTPIAFM